MRRFLKDADGTIRLVAGRFRLCAQRARQETTASAWDRATAEAFEK